MAGRARDTHWQAVRPWPPTRARPGPRRAPVRPSDNRPSPPPRPTLAVTPPGFPTNPRLVLRVPPLKFLAPQPSHHDPSRHGSTYRGLGWPRATWSSNLNPPHVRVSAQSIRVGKGLLTHPRPRPARPGRIAGTPPGRAPPKSPRRPASRTASQGARRGGVLQPARNPYTPSRQGGASASSART